jgi:predicted CXXCH cytochrome family protein
MLRRMLGLGVLLLPLVHLAGQDIDANVTVQNRKPSTVADQIRDPAERASFIEVARHAPPERMLNRARAFLARFPQSAFLFQAYDVAARASFDLGQYEQGTKYARQSLALLPENPLLLVSVADVEARQHHDEAALADAQDALEYLDRFSGPSSVSPKEWPEEKGKLKASARFARGRALLDQALALPRGDQRASLLKDCEASLLEAQRANKSDHEITYLLGLTQLSAGEFLPAAGSFALVSGANDALAPKASANLQSLYKVVRPGVSFEVFVRQAEERGKAQLAATGKEAPESSTASPKTYAYAGSESCRGCHSQIYQAWSQTGMAKMLRPYSPQNVIGDFQTHNRYDLGDDADFQDGKLVITPGRNRLPFARMEIRQGRHYFDIKQSDGAWHSYPVDYTIGSKFQQAYATRLPNGEIHVFPIQYSRVAKQWINYWKIIDGPDSERADPRSWEKLDAATSYQAICAVCHTSQLRNVTNGGFDVQNVEFREPGIDCEMCHGPSAQHVAEMTMNEPYPKQPLDPPVNFREVKSRDFLRICAQCHMQSALRSPGAKGELNYSGSRRFFPVNLSIPFGEFSRKGFYKDGRFRQTTFIVEALERSQCFRKGGVTCGACHDPHGHDAASNPKSLRFPGQPDLMCTGCHAQFQSPAMLTAHTHHASDSEASRCVSCHMPRIMDSVLFRARTHRVDDIPNPEMTQRFGQKESPNACLLCHSEKDAHWVEQELTAWKRTPQG